MNKPDQVFVLGAPRSGTTFLASLLEKTSYQSPYETQFIIKYYRKLARYGDLNDLANFERLVKDILRERAVMQLKLDVDVKQLFDELGGNVTYAGLVHKLCSMGARNPKWGDKTPHYLMDFEVLYKLFPDAKYLYIVRDGRDVALSLLKKPWGPNNIYACASYWAALNRSHPEFDYLREKGQLLELQYEDLLDDTPKVVRKLYDFLQEDIEEAEIEKLAGTTMKANYQKWKQDLTAEQIALFDAVAGKTLAEYGYETNQPQGGRVPVTTATLHKLHDKLIWSLQMFHSNVIDGIKIKFFGKEPFAE